MSWFAWSMIVAVLVTTNLLYVAWYLNWEVHQTRGMGYFGRPLVGRRALKRRIQLYSRPARPAIRLLALATQRRLMPTFEFDGVFGPPGVSSPEAFARARQYQPRPEDVFVVTQMRCGTTWMQQLVYEIVTRGA